MIPKTIGNTSAILLTELHQKGWDFFDLQQVSTILSDNNAAAIRRLLSDMVRRGLLMRLRDGIYHIVPYDRDPTTYFPDWNLAAHYLAGETPYYIGYYSALVLHDLTTQPSLVEQVVVSKPIRPNEQIVNGVTFRFILHNEQHFFGTTQEWIQGVYKINCADLEKTWIDCAFKPDYAGGIIELGKALFKSKDSVNPVRLLDYAERFGSDAVIRRLGFLLETLDILPELAQNLHQKIKKTATYVVLDTALPKTGRSQSRWGIIQNIDLETIQSANFT